MHLFQFIINSIAVAVIVATANYWLLIPALLVVLLLNFCCSLYIGASRSLKRLEVISKFEFPLNSTLVFNVKNMFALSKWVYDESTSHNVAFRKRIDNSEK